MSRTHTNTINALCTGPKTRQELIALGGGEAVATRIHEINKNFKDIQIVRIDGKYQLALQGSININMNRVYPKQTKAKMVA